MKYNGVPLDEHPIVVRVGGVSHGGQGAPMVERYHMKDVWCLHLYTYGGTLEIDGRAHRIRPGAVSLASPWSKLVYRFETESYHVSAFFTYPPTARVCKNIPEMMYFDGVPRSQFDVIFRRMEEAKRFFPLARLRAEVRVWDVLMTIADHVAALPSKELAMPKLVRDSAAYIEDNLHRQIRVPEVASQVGVTPSHLTRLFHQWLHMTVVGYVRWRRASRAHDLLVHTMRPIKAIASDVGIPDHHHFHKVIKREFDRTPGQIRNGAAEEGDVFSSPLDTPPGRSGGPNR